MPASIPAKFPATLTDLGVIPSERDPLTSFDIYGSLKVSPEAYIHVLDRTVSPCTEVFLKTVTTFHSNTVPLPTIGTAYIVVLGELRSVLPDENVPFIPPSNITWDIVI